MSLIKFEKDSSVYNGKLTRHSHNIIEIELYEKIKKNVLTSGFVVLNENNNSVQGIFKDFTTIYQSYDNSNTHYKLSNDGSIYVEPEPYVPTPEEIELQKKQEEISNVENQLSAFKNQLTSTDYKIIKEYEYSLVNKESDYDMNDLHNKRQALRDQINTLEQELKSLLSE